MDTIMAGLACGEPSTLGWEILSDYADAFLSCSDNIAAQGMRILAAPIKDDPKVISGESGAVGVGAVSEILRRSKYSSLKEQLNINSDSKILFLVLKEILTLTILRKLYGMERTQFKLSLK